MSESAKKRSNSEWVERMRQVNTGRKRKKGTGEKIAAAIAKTYEVTFPDGHIEIITNMRSFCRDHNLGSSNMSAVASGKLKQTKGFKCRKLFALTTDPDTNPDIVSA